MGRRRVAAWIPVGMPGAKLLSRSMRWARSRVSGGVLVLGYHRIDWNAPDALGLAVRPDHFAAHLELLVRHARPVSLRAASEAVHGGRSLSRAVVVTFDDGYADTLEEALPLLEQFDVPATVFVTTGTPGRPFWWNDLATVILHAPHLPDTLDVEAGAAAFRWSSWQSDTAREGRGRPREHLLRGLTRALEGLDSGTRHRALEQVRRWAGSTAPQSSVRALTQAEIGRLADSALIEIGAHTVSHPRLATIPADAQRDEMVASRRALEQVTRKRVVSCSYPYGSYTRTTLAAAHGAGYQIACTSCPDVFTRRWNQLEVPRFWTPPAEPRGFERWLSCWLAG
jgi:peptidoglycan/xylan/chitin deacetylase (PgdA/CDA1 family)